jgi:hypothetical protein
LKKLHSLFFVYTLLALPGTLAAQNYFQQEVNYTINVKLDDIKNELTGTESFEYVNNSPDELTFIYIHLWPNAYKDNNTALAKDFLKHGENKFYYAKDAERGYIDKLDFKIDGQIAKWELLKDSIDVCKLYLNQPLLSGNKIVVSTPFHVKIPSGEFSRLGHIGQSYQITQWYPKPAVYDKNGWNQMPYINQGEFYSEFGSFDVSITLPKNYVLGATGDMVDADKELEWLNQKVKETEAISAFDTKDLSFPVSDTATKTIRFKQTKVHDFAWFCDKRYHVLKGGIMTPNNPHKVTTWAMFTNAEANLWKKSIDYMNDAVYYYSLWNGDYPYNNCTAVDGTISAGGGMEYPNITVIGSAGSAFQLDLVLAHEIGHNWFYGMLGTNERTHPWMDEGINSFYENRYVETIYIDKNLFGRWGDNAVGKIFDLQQYKHKKEYELTYLISAAKNEDQAIETPSTEFTKLNYGADVYAKTAIVFDYLMAYIGENKMDMAMQKYFDEWKFKHPQPSDFRKIMEKSTGKNLNWFFDDLINSTKKLDYKVKSTHQHTDGSWDIGVKNKGEINGPIFIQGIKNNKLVGEIMFDGFAGKQLLSFPPAAIDHFKIDDKEDMPEMNRNNNTIRTKGIFKKVEPIKIQFLGSINNPDKTQIFFLPVTGWNNYNKQMFGIAFYNTTLIQKKFEYELMPMYSYTTKDLTGYGRLTYNIFPNSNLFQHISIGATCTRYAYSNIPFDLNFNKIAPELNIKFKKKHATSPYTHSIRYRNISIIQDYYSVYVQVPSSGDNFSYSSKQIMKNFNDLTYIFSKSHPITPYNIKLNLQQGESMCKTSVTANYSYKFKEKNKSVDIRFFAGTFIGTNAVDAGPYRFRLSGQRGYQDYLYDNIFVGRSETSGIYANQFTETDGGFKFYSPVGQTSKRITAINLKSSLGNLKLPLNVYADIGMTGKDGRVTDNILYNAGVSFSVKKNIFEIYFPLLLSQDFKNYIQANNLKYIETVRFILNLNLLNPFDFIKNFEL